MIESYQFPLGIAKDEYFCNRISESDHLIRNIQSCTHTVIISPRRYGKTSLAYRAIHQCGLPYVKIDLYMATDQQDIERAIIKGVNGIIAQVTGVTDKILNSIKAYIKTIKPTLEMGTDGMKLVLEPSTHANPQENICEALQILNVILKKKEQKAVLLIDEFQEVERVAKNKGIEGAIRHVAQETQCFAIIFSGSKRHLLKSMFNDRNKPLYRLCDEIALERIGHKDYFDFVNKFAKNKWGKFLSIETFNSLVECTEQHPYYLNALLRSVFLLNTLPVEEDVKRLWISLAEKKRADLFHETDILNVTQKKLLIAISKNIHQELTSKDFLSKHKLASSSVINGLKELIEEDFIEKRNGKYQFVDPLLKEVIKNQWDY